jgi:hypothetical protein
MEPVAVGVAGELYLVRRSGARVFEEGGADGGEVRAGSVSDEEGRGLSDGRRGSSFVGWTDRVRGSRDEQVKVRGTGSSPGDRVFSWVTPGVAGVVVVRKTLLETELVAYVVGYGEREEGRVWGSGAPERKLPEYMVQGRTWP